MYIFFMDILVDYEDRWLLKKYKWRLNKQGYVVSVGRGKKLHRLILNTPSGMETDHINGNKLDNRRRNLRIVTHNQNMYNKKKYKNNTVGFKGISLYEGKYQARIGHDGKRIYLGAFNTPEEAHKAYCKAAKELHGRYARFE